MTSAATAQDGRHWHAVHTCSRHEKMVAGLLSERSLDCFLPLRRVLSQWVDRKKWVEEPLFPGYLFVRIAEMEISSVWETRGVAALVGPEPGKPSVVPDAEVENIRRLLASEASLDPYPYLELGRLVRITRGPLRGIVGTLVRKSRRCLLVVSVRLLGRSVAAEIPADAVQALQRDAEYM
ncbi:MAG: UpxY family transcription antiterminator [Candidatus Brocadiae bacterium]|nr:UpxY family transcription antiterminator [Candidatus Brocadiia bacterium]